MKKILYILLVLTVVSCSKKRDFYYFTKSQPKPHLDSLFKDIQISAPPKHIVNEGDIITVSVNTDNPLDNNVFLVTSERGAVPTQYEVMADGLVNLPLVGKVPAAGLETEVFEDSLEKRLTKFFIKPFVRVNLVSFKVLLMGEVRVPGVKKSMGDRLNLLEALALGNDLTNEADRTRVKVVRYINGKASIFNVDIASTSIFTSPVFYLQSNDVVYVPIFNVSRLTAKSQQIIGAVSLINLILALASFSLNFRKK
jgi:polysaccharide export outer membrane protein